jgi:osmoprotectant transport system ATP-binding protein
MLMDEPFGATDPITRERLQDEFLRLQQDIRKTIIFVTHDFEEALRLGDRIAVLAERSHIAQFDTPANILAAPANEYVAGFIGSGATLKRLALDTVAAAELLPLGDGGATGAAGAAGASGSVTVGVADSLREALDRLVAAGGEQLTVTGTDGSAVGRLDFAAICRALDAAASAKPSLPVQREVGSRGV